MELALLISVLWALSTIGARTATQPVLVLGQEAVMETLTSVQQPMEFPHLMGVAVQPSEVLYDYVLYRNITSEYYSIGREKACST